jgi:hypothetical protein
MISAQKMKHIKTTLLTDSAITAQLLPHATSLSLINTMFTAASMRDVTASNRCYVVALIIKTIVANCAVRVSIREVQIYYFMEVTEPMCAGCLVESTGSSVLLRC